MSWWRTASLWRTAPVLVMALLAAAACGGSTGAATSAQSRTPSAAPTVSPCPAPGNGLAAWPAGIPADLPRPPGATAMTKVTTNNGVRVLRIETPTSLRESVLFVVRELPKAGYVLGRGDAEPAEADAPFIKGALRGAIRLAAVAPCRTFWLVAVVDSGNGPANNSPLLPSRSPSGSPSPLPFG